MIVTELYQYNHRLKAVPLLYRNLFLLLSVLLSLLAKSTLYHAAIIAQIGIVAVLSARITIGFWLKMLALPAIFVAASSVTLLLRLNGGVTVVNGGFFSVGYEPALVAETLALFVKSMAIATNFYLYILTTSVTELATSMRWLRIPTLFTELFVLTYKFINSILYRASQLYTSQRCRLAYSSSNGNLKSLSYLFSGLLISALHDAKLVSSAMELRGGDLSNSVTPSHNQINKWGTLMLGCVVAVELLLIRLL